MSDLVLLTRPAVEEEHPFVFATWLKCLRYGKTDQVVPDATFYAYHRRIIEHLLKKPGVSITVCQQPDEPQLIVGYMVSEPNTVHFAYVKKAFRGFGVLWRLASAMSLTVSNCSYTCWTDAADGIAAKYQQLRYDPTLVGHDRSERKEATGA